MEMDYDPQDSLYGRFIDRTFLLVREHNHHPSQAHGERQRCFGSVAFTNIQW